MKPVQRIKYRQKNAFHYRRQDWQLRVRCLCCGYKTITRYGIFDICPICFWEDDAYYDFNRCNDDALFSPIYGASSTSTPPLFDSVLDLPSGANSGLTLRQARQNYQALGAAAEEWLEFVRRPLSQEH